VRGRVNERLKGRGRPGGNDLLHAMHIVRESFPDQQTCLLNGLFHPNQEVVSYCARNLAFVKTHRKQVAELLDKMLDGSSRRGVHAILRDSAQLLSAPHEMGNRAGGLRGARKR